MGRVPGGALLEGRSQPRSRRGTGYNSRMGFSNVYDDAIRADAYATLEFPGTYYLAFRDIPALVAAHVRGTSALDFGCGASRSTRFIRDLGLRAVGVDIAAPMIARARQRDPKGDYRLVSGTELTLQLEQPARISLMP